MVITKGNIMSVAKITVRPGVILHEVIVGALRANGTSFAEWCQENGVGINSAKAATFSISGGDRGQSIIREMIAAAGPAVVEAAYRQRMDAEFNKLRGGVAA